MFDALAALALDWGRVELFQVDERIAPDGHVDRNATQLTERLLHRVPLLRHNIHLMGVTSKDHYRAAIRYEAALGAVPLDVVHLGLGDDGHTASWPPGDPVVESARAVAISCEYRGRSRMTLTPVAVNAGRARLMVVCGEDKATALADWLRGRGDPPVRYLHRTRTTLMVDRAAASQLTRG